MKKLLFAALAIVAIGAAAQSASALTVFTQGGTEHSCQFGDITCGERFSGQTLYNSANPVNRQVLDPISYQNLGFEN